MSSRLVLLGTGTCQLEPDRAASAVLVERQGLRIVFDFGRGVAGRLAELGLVQDDIRHVVLSHFHPDHLSDLIPYLHAACWSRSDPRTTDLHLWGPPGLMAQIERLLSLFEPHTLVRPPFALHLHEVAPGSWTIDGHGFASASLPPAGNHGLAWETGGGRIVLTGDSDFHDAEVAFVAGAALAIIDAGHLSEEEIVELAARAQPQRLVCSHLYRDLDAVDLGRRAAARGFAGELRVGTDREVYRVA